MPSLKAQRLYVKYTKGAARTIDIIDALLEGKLSQKEISTQYGVNEARVSAIKRTFIKPEEFK